MKIFFFSWVFFTLAFVLLSTLIALAAKARFYEKHSHNVKLCKVPRAELSLGYLKWAAVAVIPVLNVLATLICLFNSDDIIVQTIAFIESKIIKEENQ